jgi:hypothetical protein
MAQVVIDGRPDIFGLPRFDVWGRAKKFPKYVYSVTGNGCLVHKIAGVRIKWWEVDKGGDRLIRSDTPVMLAETVCGTSRFLDRAKTCAVPRPDAILCGRCHGEPATFGRKSNPSITRRQAHDRLGCIAEFVE